LRRFFFVLIAFILITAKLSGETFANPRFIPAKADPYGVHVADLNNDGRPDIYFSSRNYGDPYGTPAAIYVLLSQADGSYSQLPPYILPATATGNCVALDVNHDHNIDLVCSSGTSPSNGTAKYSTETLLGNGDGTFQPGITSLIGSGQGFSALGVGDFNGDGNSDLAVTYITAFGELGNTILLSDGTGHFSGAPSQGIGSYLTVADANNDGKADILSGDGPYSYLGKGDGTFTNPPSNVISYAACIFNDLDGDGRLDAICASLNTPPGINVIRGNGDGTFDLNHPVFTSPIHASAIGSPVKAADLNHDGIVDLILTSGNGLAVCMGKGNLQFADPVYYNLTGTTLNGDIYQHLYDIADVNGDGNLDIVSSGINGIYITYGRSDGTFDAVVNIVADRGLGYAILADFNGDGVPDLVGGGSANTLDLRLNKGDGSLAEATQIPNGNINFTPLGPPAVHGDFNGDGNQDIIAPGQTTATAATYLLNGKGDGTFAAATVLPVAVLYSNTGVSDLNNDGRDDLVRTDNGYMYARLSQPDGSFSAEIKSLIPDDQPYLSSALFAFADFNHDGKIDVAVTKQNLFVDLGNGDGSFASAVSPIILPIPSIPPNPPSYFPTDVKVGDFDGDDNPDIAVIFQNASAGSDIAIYYGDGTGGFSAPVIVKTVRHTYSRMTIADLDLDGRSDLILSYDTSNAMTYGNTVIHALDKRSFGTETSYVSGPNTPFLLFPADFNRDGFPDLLVGYSGGTFTMLTNNPGPVVSRQLTVQPEPSAIGQTFTLTATLGPPSGPTTMPTGTVTFSIDRVAVGTANLSNGTASLTLNSALSLGSHRVSAYWPGDNNYPSLIFRTTHTITRIPVTVDLKAQPNPATVGQNVMLTFSFTNAVSSPSFPPTGPYTVLDGTTTIGAGVVTAANNSFTVSGPLSPVGTHNFVVNYSGDANHASSAANLSEVINPAPSTTALTTSLNPAPYGQAITLTATISPTIAAGVPELSSSGSSTVTFSGLPGGPVTLPVVFPAGSPANTAAVVAYTRTEKIAPGTYSVTATFSGNMNLLSSTSSVVAQVVSPPPSITALTVIPGTAFQAHLVTLTANSSGVITTPTGTVQFYDGTATLASVPLSAGSAIFSTRLLSVGTHSITAVYSGDSNNAPSTSAAMTETVQPYDFSMSQTPASVSLPRGGSTATVTLTAAGIGGFAEGVKLTISGLPVSVSGTISPPTLQLTVGSSGTATLTLSNRGLSANRDGRGLGYFTAVSLAVIVLPLSMSRTKRRLTSLLGVVLCFMLLAALAGCGGQPSNTPETYSLQITGVATDTSLTHSVTLPLTITK
jgi:hypothetical protein